MHKYLSKSEFKKVNSLKIKKYRYIEGLFITEGHKIINDLILSDFEPELLIVSDTVKNNLFKVNPNKIRWANEKDLKKLSALKNSTDYLAVFKIPHPDTNIPKSEWILAADFIQDPGNLGTLIRIADWFGIKNIVCSENTVDAYNPKVVQATMGSIAHVNIHYLSLEDWLKAAERKVYAGTLDGKDIRSISFKDPGILLIGNEGNGVSEELLPYITESVLIPKFGRAESLNASVAAGIMVSFAFLKH